MRLFEKPFAFLLVACGVMLLFLPKINLVSLNNETAGLRIDDLFLLFLGILVGWAHFMLGQRTSAIERWMAVLTGFSFISFGFNKLFVMEGWLQANASVLYCVRLAEYFVFFYIGALSTQFFKTSTLIRAFFFWNVLLIILQKANILGQFTVSGYSSVSERVVGIASFPAEAGMLLNFLFCFMIFNEEPSKHLKKFVPPNLQDFFSKTYVYWIFLIFTVLVILTGSRISIVGLVLPFLYRIKMEFQRQSVASWFFASVFLVLSVVVNVVLIQHNEAVSKRSEGLLSMRNLELVVSAWDRTDTERDPIDNDTVKFKDYDLSWWIRIHKWCYALKVYWTHPECWLQGVGPGFASSALDGGLLRIVTEYGLIGCVLFWQLFRAIARQSVQLRWMMITFAINMIFIDVYLAYKVMSLLFFISGYTWSQARIPRTHRVEAPSQSQS